MQQPHAPRFSIVIPAFNVEGCLRRALDSVLAQSLQDFEVLVVDDASHDGTVALVRAMADADDRIRVFEQSHNQGPSAARNLGLASARGEWIAVLDADDAFEPDRLVRLLEFAQRRRADVVADDLVLYDQGADRRLGAAFGWDSEHRLTMENLLERDVYMRGYPLGWIKPVFRRAFIQEMGLTYPTQYRHAEDFFLLSSLLLEGAEFWLLPVPGYVYTLRIGAVSGKRSPFSSSAPDLNNIAASCDELIRAYREVLTPKELAGLRARKVRFEHGYHLHIAAAQARNGSPFKAANTLITHPGAARLLLERLSRRFL